MVGWLQISPKCDSVRLDTAVSRANRIAYVATPNAEPELAGLRGSEYAISLRPGTGDILRRDEACTVPIFNYARFFSWVEVVETIADAFRVASERARTRVSVDPEIELVEGKLDSQPHVLNRTGTLVQVEDYGALMGKVQRVRRIGWGPGVWVTDVCCVRAGLVASVECWKSGSRCERARCTARVFPFLGFFHFVLTSLHSRYVCSILIVFIHYIGSLASRSTPSVCLTSSPRPKRFRRRAAPCVVYFNMEYRKRRRSGGLVHANNRQVKPI